MLPYSSFFKVNCEPEETFIEIKVSDDDSSETQTSFKNTHMLVNEHH
jgi:hypothetical protein